MVHQFRFWTMRCNESPLCNESSDQTITSVTASMTEEPWVPPRFSTASLSLCRGKPHQNAHRLLIQNEVAAKLPDLHSVLCAVRNCHPDGHPTLATESHTQASIPSSTGIQCPSRPADSTDICGSLNSSRRILSILCDPSIPSKCLQLQSSMDPCLTKITLLPPGISWPIRGTNGRSLSDSSCKDVAVWNSAPGTAVVKNHSSSGIQGRRSHRSSIRSQAQSIPDRLSAHVATTPSECTSTAKTSRSLPAVHVHQWKVPLTDNQIR